MIADNGQLSLTLRTRRSVHEYQYRSSYHRTSMWMALSNTTYWIELHADEQDAH